MPGREEIFRVCHLGGRRFDASSSSPVALQSPIEYQRKESTSHSLGRNGKSPAAAASGLCPRSSSSMDHRQQPSLLSYSTPLSSWHPQQHSLAAKAVSGRHLSPVVHRGVSSFVSFSNKSLPPRFLILVAEVLNSRVLQLSATSSSA